MKKIVSVILLLSVRVYAADLPSTAKVEFILDYSGGLNTISPANKMVLSFTPNSENVFIHRRPGKLVKRNGFIEVGSTSALTSGRFGFTFNKEDGGKEFIVSDDSVVLTTQDFQTYVLISSALNSSVHLCAAQIRNKVWFTNGINPVFTWDGSVMQILDGTKNLPTVPRFRYIVQGPDEHVFGLNTSANASILQWQDLSSTAGVAIAPDHHLAWPSVNALHIGQGDGQVGTALWVYKGLLQIGKERAIWTLFPKGTSYFARKTQSQAGPISNESVVVLDNLTQFKGYEGVYVYDGGESVRISDPISPDVAAMQNAVTNVVANNWETQSDFAKGTFSGSTSPAEGYLTLISTTYGTSVFNQESPRLVYAIANSVLDGSDPGVSLSLGTTFYGPEQLTFNTSQITTDRKVYLNRIILSDQGDTGGCTKVASITITNRYSNTIQKSTWTGEYLSGTSQMVFNFPEKNLIFDGRELNNSSYSFKIEGCNLILNAGFLTASLYHNFLNATTVQFVSEVSTITGSITAWGNFDSVRNTNGGSIDYYFRSSTSVINITTQTWQSIAPGVVINAPILNTFVQWAATMSMVSTSPVNIIDSVNIDHIEGSNGSDRAFAIDWNNEYWLSVTTETSTNYGFQYVKSWVTNPNPHAWMKMRGMYIRSFFKDGTATLYGGAVSTGIFYRLDFGTNDNGEAIDAFYETPDLVLKHPMGEYSGNWYEKQLHEYWLDADAETGNVLRLGTSINGASFTEETVSLGGSGRILKVLYTPKKFAKTIRFRFRNNQLDKGLGFNSMAVAYSPLNTR